MHEVLEGCCIRAIASVLPSTQHPLSTFIPTYGESYVTRFQQMVGIERLHLAMPQQRASDFALAAAQQLFKHHPDIHPSDVDALFFLSQTPDQLSPITASRLQKSLGLPPTLLALDVNQGCTGFVAGLLLAANLLQNSAIRNVLIVGGDTLSHHLSAEHPSTAMSFSDGGFAAIVGKEDKRIWTFETLNEPSYAISLPHQGTLQVEGAEIFNFTLSNVTAQIQALPTPDYYLVGQTNAFILHQLARACGCDEQKMPCRIAQRGNTSGASLPTLICDLAAEGLSGKHSVTLTAFGVGLSTMSVYLQLDFNCACPVSFLSPTGDFI